MWNLPAHSHPRGPTDVLVLGLCPLPIGDPHVTLHLASLLSTCP